MDTPARNMHLAVLEDVRRKKAALEEELRDLEAVERYHQTALDNGRTVKAPTRIEPDRLGQDVHAAAELRRALKHTAKHEAAALVLKHLGRPAKIGEIVDVLVRNDYGTELKRRVLFNCLYTGMTRRNDIFLKQDGAVWALVEWGKDNQQQEERE